MNKIIPIIFVILCAAAASAQDSVTEAQTIPNGFYGVTLGLSLEDAKAALFNHPYLRFRGDPDVSILQRKEERLIQSEGTGFVERAVVQLKDNSVYLISFLLNRELVDYYSIYSTLSAKYGLPNSLSPTEAVWEDENVRMSLEKPLTVKYLDKKGFADIVSSSKTEKSLNAQAREDFLEGF